MTEIPEHLRKRAADAYRRANEAFIPPAHNDLTKSVRMTEMTDPYPKTEPTVAMNKIDYVQGDLIDMARKGDFDVIFHGCNCMGTMGSGVAKAIKNAFPEAYDADVELLYNERNPAKMGKYTSAIAGNNKGQYFVVANLYTQYGYGTNFPRFSIVALEKALTQLLTEFSDPTLRFGFPKIGAGLGGGNWEEIAQVIEHCFGKRITLETSAFRRFAKYQRPTCVELPS